MALNLEEINSFVESFHSNLFKIEFSNLSSAPKTDVAAATIKRNKIAPRILMKFQRISKIY